MRSILLLLCCNAMINICNAQFIEHEFTYDNTDYPFVNELQLADMNGNGNLDYVTMGYQNRTITIAYHNGYEAPILDTIVSTVSIRFMVLQDFDQDGDVDIIASAPFDDVSYWWRNDGNGVYTPLLFPIADFNSLLFVDMNNDNTIDMVANVDKSLIIYDWNAGNISERKTVDFDDFSLTFKGLTTFDKNGDGLLEILASDAFDGILLYEQSSVDNFNKVELLPNVFSVEKLEVDDLNNDGFYDIVATSAFNGSCKIQMNQGDDTFVEDNITPQVERIRFANLIDYDNDGDKDVVYYDVGFGKAGIIFGYRNDIGTFTSVELSTNHERVENAIAGDIDGDGDTDMVFGDNPFFKTSIIVFENNGAVSTNEIPEFSYELYPNIVSTHLIINTATELSYSILDQNGRLLEKEQIKGEAFISTIDLMPGMYYIRLQSDDSIMTEKIIKMR